MSTIYLNTVIKADIHYVFDLARNIDLHQQSTSKSHEKAIAGRTSGLIKKNETVTWRAKTSWNLSKSHHKNYQHGKNVSVY